MSYASKQTSGSCGSSGCCFSFHVIFAESPLHLHKTFINQWYINRVKRGLTQHNNDTIQILKKNTFVSEPPNLSKQIDILGRLESADTQL